MVAISGWTNSRLSPGPSPSARMRAARSFSVASDAAVLPIAAIRAASSGEMACPRTAAA